MLTLQQLMAATNAADSQRRRVKEELAGVVNEPLSYGGEGSKSHSLTPRMLTSVMSAAGAGHGAKTGSTT